MVGVLIYSWPAWYAGQDVHHWVGEEAGSSLAPFDGCNQNSTGGDLWEGLGTGHCPSEGLVDVSGPVWRVYQSAPHQSLSVGMSCGSKGVERGVLASVELEVQGGGEPFLGDPQGSNGCFEGRVELNLCGARRLAIPMHKARKGFMEGGGGWVSVAVRRVLSFELPCPLDGEVAQAGRQRPSGW